MTTEMWHISAVTASQQNVALAAGGMVAAGACICTRDPEARATEAPQPLSLGYDPTPMPRCLSQDPTNTHARTHAHTHTHRDRRMPLCLNRGPRGSQAAPTASRPCGGPRRRSGRAGPPASPIYSHSAGRSDRPAGISDEKRATTGPKISSRRDRPLTSSASGKSDRERPTRRGPLGKEDSEKKTRKRRLG